MPNAPPTKRVLVVDDERIIADTLANILRFHGYYASPAYSAEEALMWCDDKCPDVLISDVVMNGMNGIQLAVRLAERLPDCKVLLISGHAHISSLMEESETNGHNFPILAKPVHPKRILQFLAAI